MRFSFAANGRLLVAAALWAAVAVSGQELSRTQISDTLFNADGSRAVGSLRISWESFTAADGSTVVKNSVDLDIVDGIVAVALAPNLGAVPDGTYYSVEYRLRAAEKSNEQWIVPDLEEPVSIADIRVLSVPAAGMAVALSQVNGLPGALAGKADKAATNIFLAPQVLREDAPGTSNPALGLQKNDGAAGVYFRLPELSSDVTYTLPPNAGSPNQALTTDGSGALLWSSNIVTGSAYEVLQQGGTSVPQRTVANFTSGFLLSDNGGQLRTDIAPNFGTAAGTITQGNDSRLSNARTPLSHASTHAAGGSDPLTPASIGALNRTNDFMVGTSPTTPVLKLQGAPGQAAALQEWRDGSGGLAALVTAQGTGFFREIGVAAATGGTTASQFFEIGGLKKFALSATDGAFDILRYDNAGVFLDRPLRVFRSGKIETTVSMKVADAAIGSGALGLTGDYVELQGVTAPANPTSGFGRVFLNSTTGEVSVKKSSGSIVSLEGGAGGASVFADLSDVDDTGRTDGDGLLWVAGSGEWQPGTVVTPTNVLALSDKTIDGGAPRTTTTTLPSGANEMPMLRHEDNCTALTGVADGVACFEEDANTVYVCESPEGIAGVCDAAGEWTATGGSGGTCVVDSGGIWSAAANDTLVGGMMWTDENGAILGAETAVGTPAVQYSAPMATGVTPGIGHVLEACYTANANITVYFYLVEGGTEATGSGTLNTTYRCLGDNDAFNGSSADTGADITVTFTGHAANDLAVFSQTFTPTTCAAGELLIVHGAFAIGTISVEPSLVGMRVTN